MDCENHRYKGQYKTPLNTNNGDVGDRSLPAMNVIHDAETKSWKTDPEPNP